MRVKDLESADLALKRLGEVERELAGRDARLNDRIAALKQAAKEQAEDLKAEHEDLIEGLEDFAEDHKEGLFDGERTCRLAHGAFGFRQTTSVEIEDPARTLRAMEKGGLAEGFRVKREILKSVLKGWSDDLLARVKARKIVTDAFWVEADDVKVARQEV